MPNASLLRALPSPEVMKLRLRTFAMLDAIVAPERAHSSFIRSGGAVSSSVVAT